MKKTAKKLMPIPEGYVVLTKESTSVKSQWIEQENIRHFRLAEYADGTTALYRVYHGKDLNHDYESVLVQKLYCLHCGEPLTPDLDSVTGIPDLYNYHCTACGRSIEISKEDY